MLITVKEDTEHTYGLIKKMERGALLFSYNQYTAFQTDQ